MKKSDPAQSTAQYPEPKPTSRPAQTRIRLPYPFPRSTHTRCSIKCLNQVTRTHLVATPSYPSNSRTPSDELDHRPEDPGHARARPRQRSTLPGHHRKHSATSRTSLVATTFARASPMHTRCSTKCYPALLGQRPRSSAIPCASRVRADADHPRAATVPVAEPRCRADPIADEQCEPMNSNRRGIFLITKFSKPKPNFLTILHHFSH